MAKVLNEKNLREEESKLFKLIRLMSEFAKKLIDKGKAILIKRDEGEAFKNSVK